MNTKYRVLLVQGVIRVLFTCEADNEGDTMTTQVYAALNHVRTLYPEVTHVFYNDEGGWWYCDKDFEGPLSFSGRIDVDLLVEAARSVDTLPAAFSIHGETE